MGQVFVRSSRRARAYTRTSRGRKPRSVLARKGLRVVAKRLKWGNLELRVLNKKKDIVAHLDTARTKADRAQGYTRVAQVKVQPSAQGKGVGTALYKALLRKSSPGIKGIRKSDVINSDAVHSIYNKLGNGRVIKRR